MPKTFSDTLESGVSVKYQILNGTSHYVFKNIKDFVKHFSSVGDKKVPKVKDWRNSDVGDWVIADDDGIVEILYKGKMKNGGDWVRTIVGSFTTNGRMKMDTDFMEHATRYSFSKKFGATYNISRKYRAERVTRVEKEFCLVAALMKEPTIDKLAKEYMKISPKITYNSAVKRCFYLLKQEKIMNEIRKQIVEQAEEIGITTKSILENIKVLSEYSSDDNVRLNASVKLGKYIGMEDVDTQRQETKGFNGYLEVFERPRAQLEKAKEPSDTIDRSKIKYLEQPGGNSV